MFGLILSILLFTVYWVYSWGLGLALYGLVNIPEQWWSSRWSEKHLSIYSV